MQQEDKLRNSALALDEFKLLIVDDSEDDVYLLMHALRKGGLNPIHTHVDDQDELSDALKNQGPWDLVITDHNMVVFNSTEALQIVREHSKDLSVIIVSGEIAEQAAIDSMQEGGAQDFIMKDNLARLIPVICRELKQNESRKAKLQAEANYHYLAYHDTLTDLVNRREFENRLGQALQDVKRSQEIHIFMLLDLVQFKIINDTCGHLAGDELLVQVTQTLKKQIRERDTLARLGGDEFGILLKNHTKNQALQIAADIRSSIAAMRFTWQQKPFDTAISIGIVQIDANVSDQQALLACADIACFASKDKSGEGVTWYSEDDIDLNNRRSEMHWAPRIKQATLQDNFVLYLQPMTNLQDSLGPHAEFLVRMDEGDGLIPPGAFIPAAERYNLMPTIDRWVVKNVFKYLDESNLGRQEQGTYFVNLSGSTLSDQSFFEYIKQLQKDHNINPQLICFEITETEAINNLVDAVEFIIDIREKGFKFALDDFGVGLSSFTYLKTIPVDFLKVDGGFVKNMLNDPIDQGIVDACNHIAHAAGLKTVAEFIEDEGTLKALASMGVDFGQGYHMAKPGPLPIISV
jgi:diguanylate cyclase (GGDEF)-like protein